MKILNFLLPIAFIAVLVTGLVLHFKTEDREISEMENRTLQQGDFEPTFKNVVSGEYVKKWKAISQISFLIVMIG